MDQGGTAGVASGAGTRWLDDGEQRTWRAFMLSHLLLFEQFERDLQREAGLPMAYYEIMVRLSEAPDHRLRMSELADRSQSSRSRLSHAVARLEESGWVRPRELPDRPPGFGSRSSLTRATRHFGRRHRRTSRACAATSSTRSRPSSSPRSRHQRDDPAAPHAAGLVCDGAVELPAAATAPGAPSPRFALALVVAGHEHLAVTHRDGSGA